MVEAPGIEPPATSVRSVVDSRENDADYATQDNARRREVSALSGATAPVESALSIALCRAAEAGRFDVVAQLARELEARRLALANNVVAIDPKVRKRN